MEKQYTRQEKLVKICNSSPFSTKSILYKIILIFLPFHGSCWNVIVEEGL